MSRQTGTILAVLWMVVCGGAAMAQQNSIVNSPHNLSATGPGSIHATDEQQICIFCHTPHNATPVQPLWNRNLPASAYRPYTSRSLDAAPGQPTGTSKLCLSCHDGTIAVGSVASRQQPVTMAGGITTLPPGHSNLGTDLSDDHPISFRYDTVLAAKDLKLVNPAALPMQVRLDANQEMQCTSCHDAHDDSRGKFLVMENQNSQLCNSCHVRGHTEVSGHQQCASCHQPHTAPSGALLLTGQTVTESCLTCHSGQVGENQGPNIHVELNKMSRHDTNSPVDQANHIPNDVTCTDCHEGHTMGSGVASAPHVSPLFGNISGVSGSGAPVPVAQYEYEVCFKCHADQNAVTARIPRQIEQTNTRLEFAPTAVSYHPVQAAGKNADVPSLRPGLTTGDLIYCTDCHASDLSQNAGGMGANGPHGSDQTPLLIARYDTADQTPESAESFALCYRCHDRSTILSEEASGFRFHKKHLENQTPCSACHDSHGVPSSQGAAMNNSHLINFDTRIVQPNAQGLLRFEDRGSRSGACYMNCHGREHSPLSY